MRFTQAFIPTLREAPADADIVSAKLMMRAGMIRKLASGLYEWLPLGLRVLRKVENIIREEMNAIKGHEVSLPILLPKELWEETGRWGIYGKELFRIKDRKESEFCLGPTHEEVMTDLVRREVRSYRQLPLMLYQFGTKFRDEIRPRFGVMRAREFLMKDAYSYHTDENDAEKYYQEAYKAYETICRRCGFQFRAVEATTGQIGGSFSHEFMVLADTGEEEIAWCECGYGANSEKAEFKIFAKTKTEEMKPVEEVSTPGLKTVEEVAAFLKASPRSFIKTMIYLADGKPVIALVRGDFEINEAKLQSALGVSEVVLADEAAIEKITGAPLGFAGPFGLKTPVEIIADHSVANITNAVSGANKKDYHALNINIGRDYNPTKTVDIRKVIKGDCCKHCGKPLKFCRGIEIGHIFKLGYKYSKAMNVTYLDAEGKENTMVMGTYGIGVSRIVAATIEQSNDANGIIWPVSIAPYQVVIIPVSGTDESVKQASETLYNELLAAGIDVLLDDRDERAGVKFKDADLIGIPLRVTIGDKNLKNGNVEFKLRQDKQDAVKLIPVAEVKNTLLNSLQNKL